MIRFRVLAIVVLAAIMAIGTSAQAATWTWTGADPTDGDNWNAPDNWNTPAGDANIPGVGAYVGDNVQFLIGGDLIDLKGTSVDIGQLYVDNGGHNFVNTGAAATITTTDIFTDRDSWDTDFNVDVVVTGGITGDGKSSIANFYETLSAGSFNMPSDLVVFHKKVTITGLTNGLEVRDGVINNQKKQNYQFNDVLSASKVRIWSDTPQTATLTANHADTLSEVIGKTTVDNVGILNLVVAQSSYGGGVVVNAGGTLTGEVDATASWGIVGSGADIEVAENALLALSGTSSLPTFGETGAIALFPVTADGTHEYGADGAGPYKGMALGGFSGDFAGKVLRAPATTGDVEVAFMSGAPSATANGLYFESADASGVANIAVFGPAKFSGGTINQTANALTVTEFNFTSELPGTTGAMFAGTGNFTIQSDQIFNFSGAATVTIDQDDTHGEVTFADQAMLVINNTQFDAPGSEPAIKLGFDSAAAVSVSSADVLAFENLGATQVTVGAGVIMTLETGGGNTDASYSPQFDITDANNPRLVAMMKQMDINVQGGNNNRADLQGDGIQLGDGKTLFGYANSHKGLYLRADPNFSNCKIHGAGPGTTMGIASAGTDSSDYLYIQLPIDAHGATVLLNSADSIETAKSGNERYTGPANKPLRLYGRIDNAAEVVVLNSGVTLFSNTIDEGPQVATLLPIRVASTGTLLFDAAVTTLDKTQITVDQGGRVYVNDDLSVNSMVLNSTYSAGNDGLQINDADDDLTVTGTLSGNGEWGGNGRILVLGNVSPGNSVGTLRGTSGGDMTLDGATYTWQLAHPEGDNSTGEDWDMIEGDDLVIIGDLELVLNLDEYVVGALAAQYIVATFNSIDDTAKGTLSVSSVDGWAGTLSVDGGNLVVSNLGLAITPGDTNGDGVVDAADYITLKKNFGGGVGGDAAVGNFDETGTVNWADLNILTGNIGPGSGTPGTAPEPATLGLLAIGALAVIRRRRRA